MIRQLCVSITMCLFCSFFSTGVYAIEKKQIPSDTIFRKGVLSNGLTYYIVRNKQPEKMASFYIVHDVGALQEDDHQVGLAHFLEHMAFNGTKNYPDKKLLTYLESIGVRFGSNINAYTSQDRTVYMLKNVPISRDAIVDSALLVLHDWSHYISLEPEAVNAERGVIIEELRTGRNAQRRMYDQYRNLYFNNSKLAHRNVIGTEEVLRSFKQEDIVGFYNDWYRPDLQAIIVSGDVNPDAIERQIKERFSSIPARENPRTKEVVKIAPYTEHTVKVVSDPEHTGTQITMLIPSSLYLQEEKGTEKQYAQTLINSIIFLAINERLSGIAAQENAPFQQAYAGVSARSRNNYDTYLSVTTKSNEGEKGFERLMKEVRRMAVHGLTDSEFNRIKLAKKKGYEQALINRNNRSNEALVSIALGNFLDHTPMISPLEDSRLLNALLDTLKLETLRASAGRLFPDVPALITALVPEKAETVLPKEEALIGIYKKSLQTDTDPIEEQILPSYLVDPTNIKSVAIKKSSTDALGNSVWELKNGAKVVIRPTDFKKNEIQMSAFENSGTSILPSNEMMSINLLRPVAFQSGVGDFSGQDLRKFMSDKIANVDMNFAAYYTSLSGTCATVDLETMMQLLYLRYTAPRFIESDFKMIVDKFAESARNNKNLPSTAFSDTIARSFYQPNDRIILQGEIEEKLKNVSLEQLKSVYFKLLDGVDKTTFFFVGDINIDTLKVFVEKYIATLPKGKYTRYKDTKVDPRDGMSDHIFKQKMTTPKSTVLVLNQGDNIAYNQTNSIIYSLLSNVLQNKYLEIIREEKGASYGVGVGGSLSRMPKDNYALEASFDTNADVAVEMADIITQELEKLAQDGVEERYLQQAKETTLKRLDAQKKNNAAWLSWIDGYHRNNIDYRLSEEIISGVKVTDLQEMASKIVATKNRIRVIMMPQ